MFHCYLSVSVFNGVYPIPKRKFESVSHQYVQILEYQ